jgi:hypothetical protein
MPPARIAGSMPRTGRVDTPDQAGQAPADSHGAAPAAAAPARPPADAGPGHLARAPRCGPFSLPGRRSHQWPGGTQRGRAAAAGSRAGVTLPRPRRRGGGVAGLAGGRCHRPGFAGDRSGRCCPCRRWVCARDGPRRHVPGRLVGRAAGPGKRSAYRRAQAGWQRESRRVSRRRARKGRPVSGRLPGGVAGARPAQPESPWRERILLRGRHSAIRLFPPFVIASPVSGAAPWRDAATGTAVRRWCLRLALTVAGAGRYPVQASMHTGMPAMPPSSGGNGSWWADLSPRRRIVLARAHGSRSHM